MSLQRYKQKRHFGRTPEPRGKVRKTASRLAFVVQKHAARRLHYDFRLELDGVLKSWAVPKGPNPDPAKRVLAVEVEDHPYAYKDFEGDIPKGQYGAGTVEIWDKGTWTPLEEPHQGLREGKLKFELHGERLQGAWALVRMNGHAGGDKQNWLLMKKRDEAAVELTGPKSLTRVSPIPDSVEPQFATWTAHPPEGDGWIHEVKYDGYRLICMVQNGEARLTTRGGKNWTARFPRIATALAQLKVKDAIFDGEAVVLDSQGRSHFQSLQGAWKSPKDVDPILYLFDLPYLDGEDLRSLPLIDRKARLEEVLDRSKKNPRLKFSEHVKGKGDAVITAACKLALEGIISKKADAPYRSGRSGDWLKSKCSHRQEFVVIGYTDPKGSRIDFGALLLGYYDDAGQLVYAGRTGTGFDRKRLAEIKKMLIAHARPTCPAKGPLPAKERRAAHWVSPTLVAEVQFAGWTSDALVRQAVFLGLRPDKPANQVVREDKPSARTVKTHATSRSRDEDTSAFQVRLTHPERVIFPDQHITKADLATYYEQIADRMLPHVIDRPLTLYRCPDGVAKKCFMQRHHTPTLPAPIVPVKVPGEDEDYLMIRDASGLRGLVQISAIEIHGWGSVAVNIEKPDLLVFDLDPDTAFDWKRVKRAAEAMGEMLRSLKLHPFLKTTGGKGLHVVIPIEPTVEWPAAKEFCRLIAEDFAQREPDSFTTNIRKSARHGRMFIDYLRNDRTATAILPYSVRARAGAPVSVPIDWKELGTLRAGNQFTVKNLPQRLKRIRHDPWASFEDRRVDLHSAIGTDLMKETS